MTREVEVAARRAGLSAAKQAMLDKWSRSKSGGGESNRIPRRTGEGLAPLSHAQEQVWFLEQLRPGSSAYNLVEGFRLTGPIDAKALEGALRQIVQRHESLRSVFVGTAAGQPKQITQPEMPVTLVEIDLSTMPDSAEREAEALRIASAEAERPFDLEQGPLFRFLLIRLAAEVHLFVHVFHHLVFDGWSSGVFSGELAALYRAARAGAGAVAPLPELPVQVADVAAWQRESLQGEAGQKQVDYWLKQLAGGDAALQLPTDRPRPAEMSGRGAQVEERLPRELVRALRTLSEAEGATLFMTLLAAFQALLHRYGGQEEITVGTPVAGRSRQELEPLIGFFVNTLALRVDLSGAPTFRELLARVKRVALEAYAHQDVPLARLVELLQPERSLSRPPLFQVTLALQNSLGGGLALPGVKAEPVSISPGGAKYDLALFLLETDQAMEVSLEYSTDLFEAATVQRMLGHFRTLLAGIVGNPDARLADLPLLDQAERHQVLAGFNQTRVEYDLSRPLHHWIEEQVERTPDQAALVCEDQAVTYRELNRKANQLAHRLRRMGVGPDRLVGIAMERSVEMVVGLLAVLKAGGAYVPIDPTYPRDRLSYMLEDSAVSVLLTQAHLLELLPEHRAACVCLDLEWEAIASESVENPRVGVGPENLAYMIYTSGSTGRPKGALNAHRGIVNRLLWMQDEYGLTAADRVLQKTPFSFDVSVWEFFWPLMVGATLVVARPEGHKEADYLIGLIEAERITTLHFVPSMLQVFLEEPGVERCCSLKRVICSGEALPYEMTERFFARLPAVELHNLYGPTEAAVDVTYWTCERGGGRKVVPIGRPVANTQIYVLDRQMQPVPVLVPGELHIGGVQVGQGYWQRPDLTAEKFVADPFGPDPGARLYKTGDLARFLPDGTVEYLGRIDHQVKIRGLRIELGEIEAAVAACPGVAQAVVVVREERPGDKRLVAYVVPGAGQSVDVAAVRTALKGQLPDYMVPAAFVALEALPLLPNGKLDRRQLPAPEFGRAEDAPVYVAPRTPTELKLAPIWAEVLQVEQVGMNDSFFELGGHSLLAIRLMSRVQQAFGVRLPLKSLFEAPTPAGQAVQIEVLLGAGEAAAAAEDLVALPQIDPAGPSAEPYAQTYVQQAYVAARSGGCDLGACGCNNFLEFEANGVEHGPALARINEALRRMIDRHETLRTVLLPEGRQRVLALVEPFAAEVVDLQGWTEAAVSERLAADRRALQLVRGQVLRWPLFDVVAYLLDGGRLRLFIRIDTVLMDGTSTQLFLKEFFERLEEPATEAPSFTCSLRDYVGGLEAIRQSPLYARSKAYWQERLAALPPAPELPLVAPLMPETPSEFKGHGDVLLSAEQWQRLRTKAAKAAVTPTGVVLAALAEVFAAWSGRKPFTLSLVTSYRLPMHPEIHHMLGNFNSISLVAVDPCGGTFAERARRLQAQISSDVEHMYYPGFQVAEEWNRLHGKPGAASAPILVNSLIEYSHAAYASRQLNRLQAAVAGGTLGLADLHFTLPQMLMEPIFWGEADGTLAGQWATVDAAFPTGLPEAMFRAHQQLLQRLADDDGLWEQSELG